MPKRKQFEELTIQDDFMFCKVMQNMNICKKVLELVLEEDISIKKITSQQTIENNSETKAVRLDVLVEDEDNNNIDVEMQMVNNDKIPQRMRLYQANIDVYGTSKGIPYAEMPNTIIMFFCMFDPVGEGLPIYTFENICRENKEIALNDGTLKVIDSVKICSQFGLKKSLNLKLFFAPYPIQFFVLKVYYHLCSMYLKNGLQSIQPS